MTNMAAVQVSPKTKANSKMIELHYYHTLIIEKKRGFMAF